MEIALPVHTFAHMVMIAISQDDDTDVNETLFRPTSQELGVSGPRAAGMPRRLRTRRWGVVWRPWCNRQVGFPRRLSRLRVPSPVAWKAERERGASDVSGRDDRRAEVGVNRSWAVKGTVVDGAWGHAGRPATIPASARRSAFATTGQSLRGPADQRVRDPMTHQVHSD
jgi:hypothetical protein